MRSGRRRGGLALGGLLVALVAALAGPGPFPAAAGPASVGEAPHAGACRQPDGVTVVVDFTAFDGGIEVRCAGWPVSSGYDALRRAGFTVTDTQRYPGLLCRIDGLPGDQACVVAPPASAYWGYWHATRGGGWTYSSQGAGTRKPPAGSVEGWAFGQAARPGVSPPAPLPPPTTTTRPAPGAVPPPPPSAPSPTDSADHGGMPTTAPDPEPAVDSAEPGDGSPGDALEEEAAVSSKRRSVGAASSDEGAASLQGLTPAAQPGDRSSGSPAAALVTAGAVVLLGGGAVVQARRRRRSGPSP